VPEVKPSPVATSAPSPGPYKPSEAELAAMQADGITDDMLVFWAAAGRVRHELKLPGAMPLPMRSPRKVSDLRQVAPGVNLRGLIQAGTLCLVEVAKPGATRDKLDAGQRLRTFKVTSADGKTTEKTYILHRNGAIPRQDGRIC
jgi:hypothetical protein